MTATGQQRQQLDIGVTPSGIAALNSSQLHSAFQPIVQRLLKLLVFK
jgi:hypothetical protein